MPAVLTEIKENLAVVTLNRPQALNALDPEVFVRLYRAWEDLARDDRVKAVIITGTGDRAFSAGADLARMAPLLTKAREPEDEWDRELLANPELVDDVVQKRKVFPKPMIAAVNGLAIGGGLEIMMCTDIRVSVESAFFALQEVRWGLIPAGGGITRLARQLPRTKAIEMLMTGGRIDAAEAHRFGFINYVVERSNLMSKAVELAAAVAANGPLAVRAIKSVFAQSDGRSLDEAFRLEKKAHDEIMPSEDAKEGPRAFVEKRKPAFKGR